MAVAYASASSSVRFRADLESLRIRILHQIHKFIGIVFEIVEKLILGVLIGVAGVPKRSPRTPSRT